MESQRELHLPSHHLPARILAAKQLPGSQVQRDTVLLAYETSVTVKELDAAGKWIATEKVEFHELRCSGEGTIVEVKVKPGDVVEDRKQAVIVILEPCSHAVQLNGMCGVCGKDMTRFDFSGHADTARATIPITHNLLGLTVSAAEAQRLDRNDTLRLLSARKLTLVLDLDQTVIHATVDPTVGEWMMDPGNPNNLALKDVHTFTLPNDPDTVYYVKTRPHVKEFLQEVRKMYELHIYTMGTRSYADEVAKALDPEGSLFAGRVLSRDESGSFLHKSLARLFPYEQSMVVVVDDRADVWQWPPNLIRVRPYDFFVGIGDINAHVYEAAKRGEIPASDVPRENKITASSSSSDIPKLSKPKSKADLLKEQELGEDYDTENGEEPPDEELNDAVLAELDRAQKQEIEELRRARPLAEMAKRMEEAEDAAEASGSGSDSGTGLQIDTETVGSGSDSPAVKLPSPRSPTQRQQLLKDDDADVPHLLRVLTEIHTRFYELNDRDQPKHSTKIVRSEKADVREILPLIKASVFGESFQGPQVDLLFSSVIPLNTDPIKSDYYQFAIQYGANISQDLHKGITHVVAGKAGTAKVNKARSIRSDIWIVRPEWLLDSVYTFQRQPEANYLLLEERKPERLASLTARRAHQAGFSSDEDSDGEDMQILHSPMGEVRMTLENDDLAEMDREVEEAMMGESEDDEDDDADSLGDLELSEQDREDVGLVELGGPKRPRDDDNSGDLDLPLKRGRYDVRVGRLELDDDDERLSDDFDYGDFSADADDDGDPYAAALNRADKEVDLNDASPRRRAKRPRTGKRRTVDENAALDDQDEDGSASDDDDKKKMEPKKKAPSKGKVVVIEDEDELREMWGDPADLEPLNSRGMRTRTLPSAPVEPEPPADMEEDEGEWDDFAADLDRELAEEEDEDGDADD